MEIKYYDIKENQEPLIKNGKNISVEKFIEELYKNENYDLSDDKFINKEEYDSVSPEPYKNRKKWKKTINCLAYGLSGQKPSERESNLALSAAEELRQYYKETEFYDEVISRKFMFGVMPYLISGFGVKEQKWSRNDVNNLYSFLSFTDKILREDNLEVESFFCAHKKKREDEKHSLTNIIDEESFGRTLNMIKGVFENADVNYTEVEFYQPGNSYEGMISIFPSIIVETSKRGNLNDIKDILEKQKNQVQKLCNEYSNESIIFNINDIDEHVNKVLDKSKEKWGSNYRKMSSEKLKKLSKEDYLSKIALNYTFPEVERLMPYFKEPGSSEPIINKETIDDIENEVIKEALEYYSKPMSNAGKSAVETMFYYVWGKRIKEENKISIGLERDHEDYQTLAFHLGFGDNYHMTHFAPQLYARRNNESEVGGTLHKTSFRQFWR